MAQPTDAQLLAAALNEMNQGLPPGQLISQLVPQEQPQPAQPEPPTQKDWAAALQQLSAPRTPVAAAPVDSTDMFQKIQDQASAEQDKLMGQMFGEAPSTKAANQPDLPGAVDRYLERILS